MKIWLNGEIADAKGAIDARDRGVLLGDGLFETIAIVDGAAKLWDRHLARLTAGAGILGIPVLYENKALLDGVQSLIETESVVEGSLRITLLRGIGPRGVLPPKVPETTLIMSVAKGTVGANEVVRALIAKSTRRNECSPLSGIKSTNYLDAVVAIQEANEAGVDDAIMLNTHGFVAEATSANVFCVVDGKILTPNILDGALPGIMRSIVMEAVEVQEKQLTPETLERAEEIFLTSSLSIRPVVELDGMPVGGGVPGPIFNRLVNLPRQTR